MKKTRSDAAASSERRRLLAFFLAINIGLLAVSVGLLAYEHWARPLGLYFCAFARLTHLYCPACGGTRAVLALLRLDILSSLAYHPVAIALFGLAVYFDGAALVSLISGDMRYIRGVRWRAVYLIPILLLAHFILRNVLLLAFGIDPIGDHLPYYA